MNKELTQRLTELEFTTDDNQMFTYCFVTGCIGYSMVVRLNGANVEINAICNGEEIPGFKKVTDCELFLEGIEDVTLEEFQRHWCNLAESLNYLRQFYQA